MMLLSTRGDKIGKAQLLVSALLVVLLLAACAPQATPAPAAARAPGASVPAAPAPSGVRPAAKPGWEIEWEKVLAEARKEGVVAFGTSTGSGARRELSVGLKNAYGLRAESIGGTVGTVVSKILAERRAGLYLWDVLIGGASGQTSMFKPAGAISPLEPVLMLPDLTDPELIKKVWYDGKLPWVDREHQLIGALLYPGTDLGINTSLVRPGELQSWDDLLNPKWKGKILFMNPTLPGTNSDGNLMLLLYEVKGEDWVRRLATQEPVIIGDDRLAQDWLAHGKYPIYMPPRPETLAEFIQAGAPVALASVALKDGISLTAGSTTVSLIDKAPHPNAAKLFINWYLSKEGQTIISKAFLRQSARLDVPTDFLPPDTLRQPGTKYWIKDREEVLLKVADYRAKSKEIFGHLIK